MSDIKEAIRVLGFIQEYFDNHADEQEPNKRKELFMDWSDTVLEAIILLKAQEPATVEPKRIELADETKAWLDTMDAVDALGNIANICIDWDGYRTANELGGLVNEIWAYARYCAKKQNEAQEPVSVQKKPMEMVGLQTWDWACGNCGQTVLFSAKFCPWCGRAVKWE